MRAVLAAVVALAACSTTPEPADTTAAAGLTAEPPPASTPAGAAQAPASCTTTEPERVPYGLVDATEAMGLVEPLVGLHGHAAAWGDIDADGFPDLFVGTFADRPPEAYAFRGATGPNPDTLLLGAGDSFAAVELGGGLGRSSGAAFADLDGDGDLDLVVARNAREGDGARGEPTTVFRNDGGTLVEVDAGFTSELGGRTIGVLDYDQDGRLDLFITEDIFQGGSSRLFRNDGDLRFTDVTSAVGIPLDVHGLGIAVADLGGDARPDLFISGSNRLFLAEGDGFVEASTGITPWETFGNEDIVGGVDAADVDLDGDLDLVVGQHYNSTVEAGTEVPVRLYLNRGDATFEDITESAGLSPIPTKAPHVEFADMNNDGLVDIVTSASAADGTAPAVFLATAGRGGPTFETPEGLGSDQYWVAAPIADVDRDGRLDVLLVEWEPSLPSLLFQGQNEGNWISVALTEPRIGAGATVLVYEAGRSGDTDELIGARPLSSSRGYSSGSEFLAHFGLGARDAVDVVIAMPDGTTISAAGLAANGRYVLPDGCG